MQTLDIRSSAFKQKPHGILDGALAAGPFAQVKLPLLGNFKAALTHEGVHRILKDSDTFAVDARNAGHKKPFGLPFLPKSMRLLSENILSLDDPDHQRLRRLADAPFRRAAIELQRDQVGELVDEFLDRIQAPAGEPIDLVEHVFRPLPLMVISRMLGLTTEAQARLEKTMNDLSGVNSAWGILRAMGRLGGVIKQMRAEIERLREEPRPGLISELIHAEADGGKMSEDELISLVLVLFIAGHDTTTNLLSSGLYTLQTEPGAWDVAKTLDEDGWRMAVDELMRFALPVHMTKPRFVIQDTDLSGVSLKRGDRVIALLGAANLDRTVFDDPLELDLTRRPNRHTGWGNGPHICLGLHLAKMETELALSKIVARWPNLKLGENLKWSKRLGTRGFERLPVHVLG